jgi:hypothetical protein
MISTFAEALKAAEDNDNELVTSYTDSATPEGHFAALFNLDGDKLIYLFEGEKDDLTSPAKGHIFMAFSGEDKVEIHGFAQNKLTGEKKSLGQLHSYSGKTDSIKGAFAQMV